MPHRVPTNVRWLVLILVVLRGLVVGKRVTVTDNKQREGCDNDIYNNDEHYNDNNDHWVVLNDCHYFYTLSFYVWYDKKTKIFIFPVVVCPHVRLCHSLGILFNENIWVSSYLLLAFSSRLFFSHSDCHKCNMGQNFRKPSKIYLKNYGWVYRSNSLVLLSNLSSESWRKVSTLMQICYEQRESSLICLFHLQRFSNIKRKERVLLSVYFTNRGFPISREKREFSYLFISVTEFFQYQETRENSLICLFHLQRFSNINIVSVSSCFH